MDAQDNSKNDNKNPHIKDMKEDVLYHIGLSTGAQDLKAMFGDVKVQLDVQSLRKLKVVAGIISGYGLKVMNCFMDFLSMVSTYVSIIHRHFPSLDF